MVSSKENRVRLCDPITKRLPFIKQELRKKILSPWFRLSEKELVRIRKPFESYEQELLEDGYPESSQHLQRLLAVTNKLGERDTVLIDDKHLLNHTMNCLKQLENFEREGCSISEAIDNLIHLANKMTKTSSGIACILYELILNKMSTVDCTELSKCELKCSFGKFLVEEKDYAKANKFLQAALEHSEKNDFAELSKKIRKLYYKSLYESCLNTTDEELAIQLAHRSKDIALKMNDFEASAKSLIQSGSILMAKQRLKEAVTDFQAAISELKKSPNLNLKVEVLYKLSTCYFTLMDYDSCILALGALGRLATIYKKIEYEAHFCRIDGTVKLLMGQNLKARTNFLKSIEIYEKIGLHEYATNCRFLEAVAKCKHLTDPWINLLINFEREKGSIINKSSALVYNWKLRREYFSVIPD